MLRIAGAALLYASSFACGLARGAETAEKQSVIVVVGAAGEEEYGKQFAAWAERWKVAALRGGAMFTLIGTGDAAGPEIADRKRLEAALDSASRNVATPVWLVLIGHGTFDGKHAKYNLRGPDVSSTELAAWCEKIQRPLVVIDCTSASGPFLKDLAGPNRVVVTATRSGSEQNFARFGDELSAAIGDPTADLDKDDQTSLLEAYLRASRRVEEWYAQAGRLATEHALLDDNGDGLGTPAAWFAGIRAVKKAKEGATLDGSAAHRLHLVASAQETQLSDTSRERRDALEKQIAQLRANKSSLSADEYYSQLEVLVIELAKLYATP